MVVQKLRTFLCRLHAVKFNYKINATILPIQDSVLQCNMVVTILFEYHYNKYNTHK